MLGSTMRSVFEHVRTLALAILAVAAPSGAVTFTPATTPPTAEVSPAAMPSPLESVSGSPHLAPSPPTTTPTRTPRRAPQPSASPTMPTAVDPTPDAMAEDVGDESLDAERPPEFAIPTAAPAAPVRPFRTPEREAPPAFVAPQVEPPPDADGAQADPAASETMPPPDQPYIATITFRALAGTEIDGFELMVIYPRDAGDFVGTRNNVECRNTGDGTMFADDMEDGMLRILVASNQPLTFPIDVVCRFTVAPNAVLTSRLIAVNIVAATLGDEPAESSALTVSVNAR
jgi:hypothetical protein